MCSTVINSKQSSHWCISSRQYTPAALAQSVARARSMTDGNTWSEYSMSYVARGSERDREPLLRRARAPLLSASGHGERDGGRDSFATQLSIFQSELGCLLSDLPQASWAHTSLFSSVLSLCTAAVLWAQKLLLLSDRAISGGVSTSLEPHTLVNHRHM